MRCFIPRRPPKSPHGREICRLGSKFGSPAIDLNLGIGAGEDAAISLAVELGNATLLMDDLKARAAARARGFVTIGTIAILDRAAQSGLLDFETAINNLRATTFHLDEAVVRTVINKARARKKP